MCDPGHRSSLKNGWAHISMVLMWEEGHTPRGSSQSQLLLCGCPWSEYLGGSWRETWWGWIWEKGTLESYIAHSYSGYASLNCAPKYFFSWNCFTSMISKFPKCSTSTVLSLFHFNGKPSPVYPPYSRGCHDLDDLHQLVHTSLQGKDWLFQQYFSRN